MLVIGICDDSAQAREALRWALEGLLEEAGLNAQILDFASGEALLSWYKDNPDTLNLLFLDIEMPKTNGMATARVLRTLTGALQIVFVTGYSDYVYDGYSVGALGYLLKPAKRAQLAEILKRAQDVLTRTAQAVYVCRSGDNFYRIPRAQILYFTSDRRQVRVVTRTHTYTFYGKLSQVEEDLADARFVRIHQSFLVNADAVVQLTSGEVRLANDETLPISRSCQASAMAALTRAMLS